MDQTSPPRINDPRPFPLTVRPHTYHAKALATRTRRDKFLPCVTGHGCVVTKKGEKVIATATCRPVPANGSRTSIHAEEALLRKLPSTIRRKLGAAPRYTLEIRNLAGGPSAPCSRCVRLLPPGLRIEYTDRAGVVRKSLPKDIDAQPSGGIRRM